MTAARERYVRAWASMRRWGALYFGLAVSAFGLTFVLGGMHVLHENWLFALYLGALALIALTVGRRWYNYPCPRCGKSFRRNQQTRRHNPAFSSACANCQLIGGSLPEEESR